MKRSRLLRSPWPAFCLGILCLIASPLGLRAHSEAIPDIQDIVKLETRFAPATARPGDTVTFEAELTILEHWHVYPIGYEGLGIPTAFTFEDSGSLQQDGDWQQPEPVKFFDKDLDEEVQYHEGSPVFRLRFKIPADAKPGIITIKGSMRFQACATMCKDDTYPFSTSVTVDPNAAPIATTEIPEIKPAATGGGPAVGPATGTGSETDQAIAQGLWSFILLALGSGFASLAMPCVFPMIPVTMSYFIKQAEHDHKQLLPMATVYCLGIIVIFTLMGLGLALAIGASGASDFATNPWVNLLIGGIFIAFALSLFGLFNIQIPSSWLNAMRMQGDRGGYAGVLFLGFTFSLASFTCTAPFVGGLLAIAAKQGEWLWAVLGMVLFSSMLALPFFVLSLFPKMLTSMPGAGGWMNNVKIVMGMIELAAAVKFISNADVYWQLELLPRTAILATWAGMMAVTTVYIFGWLRVGYDDAIESIGVARLLFGTAAAVLTLYLTAGLFGKTLNSTIEAFMPPPGYGEAAMSAGNGGGANGGAAHTAWLSDYETAAAEARATNRPMFIDFTGVN